MVFIKVGEDEPGDPLGRDSAFAVAIKNLSPDWNIDLSNYKLIDESEKIKPNGELTINLFSNVKILILVMKVRLD